MNRTFGCARAIVRVSSAVTSPATLGKATKTFQDYLLSFASDGEGRDDLRGKIDHSTAGAQCLLANIRGAQQEECLQGIVARFLAICIASHHSGLIDCLEPDGNDK